LNKPQPDEKDHNIYDLSNQPAKAARNLLKLDTEKVVKKINTNIANDRAEFTGKSHLKAASLAFYLLCQIKPKQKRAALAGRRFQIRG
jgi:hypothetical protein